MVELVNMSLPSYFSDCIESLLNSGQYLELPSFLPSFSMYRLLEVLFPEGAIERLNG